MSLFILRLEDRILFDAAAHAVIAHALADHVTGGHQSTANPEAVAQTSSVDQVGMTGTQAAPSDPSSHDSSISSLVEPAEAVQPGQVNVLLIASNVDNAQQLANAAAQGVITILYDYNNTSLSQLQNMISTALGGKQANSISFATEGETGLFFLTKNIYVSSDTLTANSDLSGFWKGIGDELAPGGRVDLLGCFVGGAQGDNFGLLSNLTSLIDSDGGTSTVAAATHVVGNIGGSWILNDGNIDASSYFNTNALAQWANDLGNIFTVENTASSGTGSLTQEIADANAAGGTATNLITVNFDPANVLAGSTINLGSTTSNLTGNFVTIDGTSVGNYKFGVSMLNIEDTANSLAVTGTSDVIQGLNFTGSSRNGNTGIAELFIDGGSSIIQNDVFNDAVGGGLLLAGNSTDQVYGCYIGTTLDGTASDNTLYLGLTIQSGTDIIGGPLASQRNIIFAKNPSFSEDVQVTGSGSATFENNYIGVNINGVNAGEAPSYGIYIQSSGAVTIGGTSAGDGNLISGNSDGIYSDISQRGTVNILGNDIGTGPGGLGANGNGTGFITDTSSATINIGNGTAGSGNIIAANSTGLDLAGNATFNVLSDSIGVDANGNALGNSTGVFYHGGVTINVGNGTASGRNVISGNTNGILIASGSAIIEGNYIGTNAAGTSAIANSNDGILIQSSSASTIGGTVAADRNIISGNTVNGIEVSGAGTSLIEGNLIGLNAAGTAALTDHVGILISSTGASQVGGGTSNLANTISGNTTGVSITNGTQTVEGNFIGTNSAGTAALPNTADGIDVSGGTNSVIGGIGSGDLNVISGNGGNGIAISGGSGLQVEGNYIGTNAAGTAALRNSLDGISVIGGTTTVIGGGSSGDLNVISGNGANGIVFAGGNGTTVEGNRIGTTADGTAAIANTLDGILISSGNNIQIGGASAGQGNLISGNTSNGIQINGGTGAIVYGNTIGLNVNGAVLSNQGDGVNFNASGARSAVVGGVAAGQGNIIAHNIGEGVRVNNADGANIRGNSIYDNGDAPALGINLGGTPIGNDGQQPPSIFVDGVHYNSLNNQTAIAGTFTGTNGTTYNLDFYANPTDDGLGIEGKNYVGTLSVTGTGVAATYFFVMSGSGPVGTANFTATASVSSTAPLNTSEFSGPQPLENITLTNSTLNAVQGQTVIITSSNLTTNDPGQTPAQIVYTVTTLPTNGTLFDNGVPLLVNGTFTQTDINNGLVAYTQNGSATPSDSFGFNVSDQDGDNITGQTLSIAITELPVSGSASVTTNENTPYTFATTDFPYSDIYAGNNEAGVRVNILPATGTLIDPNIGTISAGTVIPIADISSGAFEFVPAANNYGAPYTTFTFSVEDSSTPNLFSTSETATVDVTGVPPTSGSATLNPTENQPLTLNTGEFPYNGAGPGDPLKAIEIDTLPTGGTILDNGVAVTPGQFIPVSDFNSNEVTYVPPSNVFGNGSGSFTFTVEDSSTPPLSSATNTATINITEAVPTSSSFSLNVNENGTVTFNQGDFPYTDPNNGISAVEVVTAPTGGQIFDNGSLVTGNTLIPISDINNNLVTYTPNANTYGSDAFNFQVVDSSTPNLSSPVNTATLDITSVHPTTANIIVNTNENTGYVFKTTDFAYSDTNNVPELDVKITAAPYYGTLLYSSTPGIPDSFTPVAVDTLISYSDIANGDLVFQPAPNSHLVSYTQIGFRVDDSSSPTALLSNTKIVTINVNGGPPTSANGTVQTAENTNYDFKATDFSYSDPSNSLLGAIEITSGTQFGTLKYNNAPVTIGEIIPIANIGELVYTPPANSFSVPYTQFAFQVIDSLTTPLHSGNYLETINVTGGPPKSAAMSVTTIENAPYAFKATDFPYTDPSGSLISAIEIDASAHYGTLKYNGVAVIVGEIIPIANIGELVYTPPANSFGISFTQFAFEVEDSLASPLFSGNYVGTINITEAPPQSQDPDFTTNVNRAYTFTTANFPYSDINPGDKQAGVKFNTLPTNGIIIDNNVAVTTNTVVPINDIANGLVKFVPLTSSNTPTSSFLFSVEDSSGNPATEFSSPVSEFVNVNPADAADGVSHTAHNSTLLSDSASAVGYLLTQNSEMDSLFNITTPMQPAAAALFFENPQITVAAPDFGSNFHGNEFFSLVHKMGHSPMFEKGERSLSFNIKNGEPKLANHQHDMGYAFAVNALDYVIEHTGFKADAPLIQRTAADDQPKEQTTPKSEFAKDLMVYVQNLIAWMKK